jgi:hypothetical protein
LHVGFRQRPLRRAPPLGGVEPEAQQRGDEPAGAGAVQRDGAQVVRRRIALDEERVEDAQGAPALDALERADGIGLQPQGQREMEDDLGVGRASTSANRSGSIASMRSRRNRWNSAM